MKFKFLNLLVAVALVTSVGCKKNTVEEKQEDPTGDGGGTTEVIPDTFIKRVLIEEFTGEWCQACPSGAATLENIINNNGDKAIGVAVHGNDPFQTSQTNYLDNQTYRYYIQFYPSAIIDRIKTSDYTNNNSWANRTSSALTDVAKLGIKLETSIDNGLLDITATVVANEVLDNAYITIYLLEDNVPESSYGAQSGAAPGYIHNHLLRKVLTANGNGNGDDLNITEARVKYTKTLTGIDISSYKQADLKVVALVNEYTFIATQQKCYNVKEVHAGSNSDWN